MTIYISPSQIETWETCPRKWGIRYIDGVRSPSSPAAELGTRCHDALEAWLKEGIPPDPSTQVGRIVSPALPHLPAPLSCSVEGKVTLDSGHGWNWTGKIDFRQRGEMRPADHSELWGEGAEEISLVGDHKTSKDIYRYGKSAEFLRTEDPQGLLYSLFEARIFKEREGRWPTYVDCLWSYMKTAGTPGSRPIRFRGNVEETRARVEAQLVPIGKDILYARDNLKEGEANRLPIKTSGCSAFGGCPHAKDGSCTLTKKERFSAAMGRTKSLKELVQQSKKQTGDAPAPTPAPEDAGEGEIEVEEEEPTGISDTERNLAKRLFDKGRKPADTAPPGVKAAYAELEASAPAAKEEPKPEPEPEPAPVVRVVKSEPEPEPEEPKAEAPKKRGRPKGSTNVKKKKTAAKKASSNPLDGLKEAVERFEKIEEAKPVLAEKVEAAISALEDLKAALEDL